MANLLATYGIAREARVALLLLDTVDFPVAFWGAIKAGVVPVVPQHAADHRAVRLHPRRQPRQGAVRLGAAAARRAADPGPAALPQAHLRLGRRGAAVRAVLPRRAAASSRAEFQAADTCCDETAFWLYSSGSTGMPKGVRHVHSSPMETARLTGQGCSACARTT